MIRIALLGLAITLAGVSDVSAQTSYGAGTVTCGEWLQVRSSEQNKNAQLLASSNQVQAWIDGFLSGYSVAGVGVPDFLASHPDSSGLYAWLDNYCRSKPNDLVLTAAVALVKELQTKAEPK